jgi:hypothetical protein
VFDKKQEDEETKHVPAKPLKETGWVTMSPELSEFIKKHRLDIVRSEPAEYTHDMFPKAEKDIQLLKSIDGFKIKAMRLFDYRHEKEEKQVHTSGCQLTFADDTTVLLGKKANYSRTMRTPWPVTRFSNYAF